MELIITEIHLLKSGKEVEIHTMDRDVKVYDIKNVSNLSDELKMAYQARVGEYANQILKDYRALVTNDRTPEVKMHFVDQRGKIFNSDILNAIIDSRYIDTENTQQ